MQLIKATSSTVRPWASGIYGGQDGWLLQLV